MSFSLAARPRKAGICEILQIFENRARTQATEPNTPQQNGTTRWGGWTDRWENLPQDLDRSWTGAGQELGYLPKSGPARTRRGRPPQPPSMHPHTHPPSHTPAHVDAIDFNTPRLSSFGKKSSGHRCFVHNSTRSRCWCKKKKLKCRF